MPRTMAFATTRLRRLVRSVRGGGIATTRSVSDEPHFAELPDSAGSVPVSVSGWACARVAGNMRDVVEQTGSRAVSLRWWPSNVVCSLLWLFLSATFVLAMANAVFHFLDPVETSRGWLFAQSVAPAALFARLFVRALRRCVSASGIGITVRKTFRTRHYDWEAIEKFDLWEHEGDDEPFPWAFAEMDYRSSAHSAARTKRLPLGGGLVLHSERLAQWVEQLNRELEHHRQSRGQVSQHPPGDTQPGVRP